MKWRDTGFAQANRPSSRESARDAAAHVANRPTCRVARGPAAAWAQFDGARESASRDFFDRTEPSPRARAQELIKKLRVASGAPITDCKKAISEVGDDLDAAFEWLRKKGAARASEKSGRATQHVRLRKPRQWRARSLAESHTFFRAQGLVGALVAENGTHAVLVEVNSETDFVARNEHFQRFVADVAASASARVEGGADGPAVEPLSVEAMLDLPMSRGGLPTRDALAELVGKVGESCVLRRATLARAPAGAGGGLGVYMHNVVSGLRHEAGGPAPVLGVKGAVVALRGGGGGAAVEHAAKRLAMHVVAARPRYLTPEDVPDADLEREREILREQTRAAAGKPKPPEIVEKIINGKLNKFYTETTLLQQPHLAEEGSPAVSKVLEGLGAEAGEPVALHGFAAFHCGEP